MELDNKMIVVPWDFTPVAECALKHAAKISRMTHADICLLHIVDKITTDGGVKAKQVSLNTITTEASRLYGLTFKYHVMRGTIFKQIAEFVNDREASLVVMGTHGNKTIKDILLGTTIESVRHAIQIPLVLV